MINYCPYCGAKSEAGHAFCDQCGRCLTPAQTPSSADGGTAATPKKRKKAVIIIVIVAVIVLIIGGVAALLLSGVVKLGNPGPVDINITENSSSAQNAEDSLGLADEYLSEGKYEEAISEYDNAIAADPDCVDAYIGKYKACVAAGKTSNAKQALQDGYNRTGDVRLYNYLAKTTSAAATTTSKPKTTATTKEEQQPEEELVPAPSAIAYISDSNSITLTWGRVADAAMYKVLMFNTALQKYEEYETTSATFLEITDLKPGTTYKFKIISLINVKGTFVEQETSKIIYCETEENESIVDDGGVTVQYVNAAEASGSNGTGGNFYDPSPYYYSSAEEIGLNFESERRDRYYIYKVDSARNETVVMESEYPLYCSKDGYIVYYKYIKSNRVKICLQDPSGELISEQIIAKSEGTPDWFCGTFGTSYDRLGRSFIYTSCLYNDSENDFAAYKSDHGLYIFKKDGTVITPDDFKKIDPEATDWGFSYDGVTTLNYVVNNGIINGTVFYLPKDEKVYEMDYPRTITQNNVSYSIHSEYTSFFRNPLYGDNLIIKYIRDDFEPEETDGYEIEVDEEYVFYATYNVKTKKSSGIYKNITTQNGKIFTYTDIDGNMGYLDGNGREIDGKFDYAEDFMCDYSFVKSGGKYYLIDSNAETLQEINGTNVTVMGENWFGCERGGELYYFTVK